MEIGRPLRVVVDVRSGELELSQAEQVGIASEAVRDGPLEGVWRRPLYETIYSRRFPNAAAAIFEVTQTWAQARGGDPAAAELARAWLYASILAVRDAVDPATNLDLHPYILLREYRLRFADVVALYERLALPLEQGRELLLKALHSNGDNE